MESVPAAARENLRNVNGRLTAERMTLKVAGTGPRTDGGENCWAKLVTKIEVSIREGMTEHQKILYWAFSKLRAASQSYDRSLQVERLASFVCIGIYGTAGAIDVLPLQKTWRRGTKTESTNW